MKNNNNNNNKLASNEQLISCLCKQQVDSNFCIKANEFRTIEHQLQFANKPIN